MNACKLCNNTINYHFVGAAKTIKIPKPEKSLKKLEKEQNNLLKNK